MALNKTTTNAIADQAISSTKIEDGAITSTKISDATTISVSKTTITAVPPTITSLNVSQIDPSAGATVTITGTGFIAIPDVKFMNTTTGVRITPSAIGFTSSTQLTAAFPSGQTVGIYKVIVENPNGLSVLSTATITYSIAPAWATAEGSLGSFEEGDTINLSLLAYDDDSTAVTSYTLQSGSLPSGITLDGDSTIGSITGTAPNVDADTAFNFTIRAADNESQTSDRTFSMTITNWEVDNSLRFNDGSSDSLTRTPASTSNQKTFTISFWIKRSALSTQMYIFETNAGNYPYFHIRFRADNTLDIEHDPRIADDGLDIKLQTTQLFRDVSAWYHIVLAVDTTQATDTNRCKLYVNGEQVTSFSSTAYPTLNLDILGFNSSSYELGIGKAYSSTQFFDGYMSEIYEIDGQALDPTSFGETDATSGIWIPKKYSGSYGTNGFHLKFDNSEALGADSSGNGNNFTVNNLTAIDQTTDTPQNNFATMNAVDNSSVTLSEGNLSASCASPSGCRSTIGVTTGKWYVEVKYQNTTSMCGVVAMEQAVTSQAIGATIFGQSGGSAPELFLNGSTPADYNSATAFTANDIMQIALDMDSNTVYFGLNGSWFDGTSWNSASPNTGHSLTTGYTYGFRASTGSGTSVNIWNFGNPPFTISSGNSDAEGYGNFEYSVPTGYYAINTKNLAEYG